MRAAALRHGPRAAGRLLVVVVLAVVVTLLTTGASGEHAGRVLRAELDGEPARLTMPTGDGPPVGLALYFHGQGGDVDDRIDGPFLNALRRDGWAIASSEFHGESWGNEASTADTQALTEWAEAETGVETSMWVSGSMGGSVSLNAMLHGVEPPPCWYGVKPAISLTQMDTVPGATRFLAEAYGGPVPEDRNTVRHIADLPDDVRYRVVASPEDDIVDLDQNGGALVSQLFARGVDVTYALVVGPHDDPSHFNPTDLQVFARSCLTGSEMPSDRLAGGDGPPAS